MNHRIASAKAGITPADMAFIEALLAKDSSTPILAGLCEDPDSLQTILDLKEIHQGLLESPVALAVSASLYFYVLVRHAFLDGGIDHVGLADYVAGVLVEKLDARPDSRPGAMPGWVTHAVDFVSVIQSAHGALRFQLQVAAGNQFLILAGLYPGFLEHRAERRGAPNVEFYETFARHAYRCAADHPGIGSSTRELLGLLSETFPVACRSLNRISDRNFF